jgi:hypothetical protein
LLKERGWDAAPDALRLAKSTTSLDQFWERWASMPADGVAASPERAAAYFEALLNGEREALLWGHKETFLMFQDEAWRGLQERYFWLAQENDELVPSGPIVVRHVQVSGNRARVQLAEPLPFADGLPPQSLGATVYLQWQGGGWRHASALDGYAWPFPPPVALTLTPTPAPTPVAGQGSD